MSIRTHATRRRLFSGVACSGLVTGALVLPALSGATTSALGATPSTASTCQLGHGISHVVNLVFDNVHFGRDNPNVPSDLERMPALMHFMKNNGTILSNTHTPLIAHTADDSLSIYTGLYGDRHGQPLSNSYKTYNPDGTTDGRSRHHAVDGLLRHRPGQRCARPADAGPLGALHPCRLQRR
jgi:hypothetical protein